MDQLEKEKKLNELIKGVDKLLKRIPGDGQKTAIGAGLLAALPHIVEAFPQLLSLAPYLNLIGLGITLLGLAHKPIKVMVSKMGDVTVLARDGKPGVRSAMED